eukprot:TRINITY_DN35706_c0_g1_i1.p1 TRINITY_DN35706_c0_g1~~TRINITY_DN35706_c0_g1_i1.p1  ORF type:complete len:732 (+),score=157.24 TRINITY_DN35706_c0_g1_i1:236-2197(+)
MDSQDFQGYTPIQVATIRGCNSAVGVLASLGADRSVRDSRGRGLFSMACQYGHKDLVEMMLPPVVVSDPAGNDGPVLEKSDSESVSSQAARQSSKRKKTKGKAGASKDLQPGGKAAAKKGAGKRRQSKAEDQIGQLSSDVLPDSSPREEAGGPSPTATSLEAGEPSPTATSLEAGDGEPSPTSNEVEGQGGTRGEGQGEAAVEEETEAGMHWPTPQASPRSPKAQEEEKASQNGHLEEPPPIPPEEEADAEAADAEEVTPPTINVIKVPTLELNQGKQGLPSEPHQDGVSHRSLLSQPGSDCSKRSKGSATKSKTLKGGKGKKGASGKKKAKPRKTSLAPDAASAAGNESYRSLGSAAPQESHRSASIVSEGSLLEMSETAAEPEEIVEETPPYLALYEHSQYLMSTLPQKKPVPPEAFAETDHDGRTPLMLAAEEGHLETVALLLQRKADVNAIDSEGNTVLMAAAMSCHSRASLVAELLLNEEADAEVKNAAGRQAVELAQTSAAGYVIKTHVDRLVVARRLGKASRTGGSWANKSAKSSDSLNSFDGRVRFDHLPRNLPAELIEAGIREMLKKRRAPVPQRIEVAVHPITQECSGHAYVDYDSADQADALAESSGKGLFNNRVPAVMIREANLKSSMSMPTLRNSMMMTQ